MRRNADCIAQEPTTPVLFVSVLWQNSTIYAKIANYEPSMYMLDTLYKICRMFLLQQLCYTLAGEASIVYNDALVIDRTE